MALLSLTALAVAAEMPRTKPDRSQFLFTNGLIPNLHLEVKGTNLTQLRRNDREYVRATLREGTNIYSDVGLHLKGAAGSNRGFDDRPALTLNFDKFKDGQKFHGLDKIHLNNSVQDRSYLTEILCGDLFLAAGVPAARGTHARVFLNGRDLGLYGLKEGFDRSFLRRHFRSSDGNLYDGGFLHDLDVALERTSTVDDVKNRADLKAVVAAANEPDPSLRLQKLEQVLDLDRFLTFIALEVMTWHWDGYAMKKNNYRVYHDPTTGRCVFFPHGLDQMFWSPDGTIFPNFEGLVARQVLAAPEGKRRYRERIGQLLTNVFQIEALTNRINELHARIRPVLQAIDPQQARENDGAVQHIRNQVVQRAAFLRKLMSLPEAKPVRFDEAGYTRLTDWRPHDPQSTARLDTPLSATGLKTLHIEAGPEGKCTAAWRTRVLLPGGAYVLEGRVRTHGVANLVEPKERTPKGNGAGLRLSGTRTARTNEALGDSPWQLLEFPFTVKPPQDEIELICELRATAGEAWFDASSLRVRRAPGMDATSRAPVPKAGRVTP